MEIKINHSSFYSSSYSNLIFSCAQPHNRVSKVVADQSHYREVPRWEIFMEQELRFGLDLGQMANFPALIASKSVDL